MYLPVFRFGCKGRDRLGLRQREQLLCLAPIPSAKCGPELREVFEQCISRSIRKRLESSNRLPNVIYGLTRSIQRIVDFFGAGGRRVDCLICERTKIDQDQDTYDSDSVRPIARNKRPPSSVLRWLLPYCFQMGDKSQQYHMLQGGRARGDRKLALYEISRQRGTDKKRKKMIFGIDGSTDTHDNNERICPKGKVY